ncbi:hypothetical protein [Halorarius halobius]|uniref:hypothetical protein n=1 Tax=Halorarius halobius TaxID=2962671 RepID=UPI0020CFC397|nr:hypothetical protein [Halorarius halobius]
MSRDLLHVDLSDEAMAPGTVPRQIERLHGLETTSDDPGFLDRLTGGTSDKLTYEVLLVAPGGGDPALDYYLGCQPADALDTLATVCSQLFPHGYEFSTVSLDLTDRLDGDPRAARQLHGRAERRDDWQLQLTPYGEFHDDDTETSEPPLASAAATLADCPHPAVYQALLRPKPDYTAAADMRRTELKNRMDTAWEQLLQVILGPHEDDETPDRADLPASVTSRLDALDEKDHRNAFQITARAVVFDQDTATAPATDGGPATDATSDTTGDTEGVPTVTDGQATEATTVAPPATTSPERVCETLASAFSHVGGGHYTVDAVTADPDETWRDLVDREHASMNYMRPYTLFPGTTNRSPAIVADPGEAATFCVFGGDSLPDATHQAVAPTPSERTALQPLPTEHLKPYRTEGLTLGTLEALDEPLALPPALQPLHTAWFGPTGSGKSTALARAALDNAAATDGADVFVLPKGAGMATDYLRAYYARYGDLEGVYYLDCARTVPALTFFDIRADLEAGIPRDTAIGSRIDHYLELLDGLLDTDDDAKRARDVIGYLIEALFDPVHGADAFSHQELHDAAKRMRDQRSPPPVSEARIESLLESVVHDTDDMFGSIMSGVLTRIEKVPRDRRLARLFNHVTEAAADEGDGDAPQPEQPGETRLDFTAYLDEDVTIILDMGDLGGGGQRALTLAVLSTLWSACKRRASRQDDPPLVNCYIEEAATVAETNLLADLLSQGRAFGLAITLAMQFPGQLSQKSRRAYGELLNDVGTIITGPIGQDDDLAARLATDDMPQPSVGARLRGLDRGQWLVDAAAPFRAPSPRPFELVSADPPAAHPASDEDLTEALEVAFESRKRSCIERTRERMGLPLALPSTTAEGQAATAPGDDTEAEANDERRPRVDSALPYTSRLPSQLRYDADRHGIVCTECEAWYEPTADGLTDAVDCHPDGEVDSDDIPICQVNLPLDREQRAATGWSDAQLMFLRAVYRAHRRRYDAPCYDLLHDSMIRLREYIDIDPAAVDELLEAGLLRHDGDYPHRLYTVTPEGRDVIGVDHRRGVAHGHGKGDLGESTQHVMGVEVGEQLFEQEFVTDPDSNVVEVQAYYDLESGNSTEPGSAERLDLAGLDADGEIVVTGEVERINHDVAEAVPEDFDKMASCDPEEAIWIVLSHSAGREVVEALNDPPDGEPRLDTSYSESTPVQQYRLDAAGATAVYPFDWLRSQLEAADPAW